MADEGFAEFFGDHEVTERTAHEFRQRYLVQAMGDLVAALKSRVL